LAQFHTNASHCVFVNETTVTLNAVAHLLICFTIALSTDFIKAGETMAPLVSALHKPGINFGATHVDWEERKMIVDDAHVAPRTAS